MGSPKASCVIVAIHFPLFIKSKEKKKNIYLGPGSNIIRLLKDQEPRYGEEIANFTVYRGTKLLQPYKRAATPMELLMVLYHEIYGIVFVNNNINKRATRKKKVYFL